MLIVPLELYKRIGYWFIRKNIISIEGSNNTREIIELEKRYIEDKDDNLRRENDKLIKKLGGVVIRI